MRTAGTSTWSGGGLLGRVLPPWGWWAVLLGLGLIAWLAVLLVMADMDEGPGTPLHTLPVFIAGWVLMLAAMMLPTELTYVGAFSALLKSDDPPAASPAITVTCFLAGYWLAWIGYGLLAYVLDALIRSADLELVSWFRAGPLLVGSVLVLAGLYQVSPLKRACLNHCRSPISYFARHWREGRAGATAMGLQHGLVCVGCCWALMAVMFAVGAMSLTWMALLTVFMFAEKLLPHGEKLTVPIACFLWAMGLWIAVSPDTAPLLKDPLLFGGICRSVI